MKNYKKSLKIFESFKDKLNISGFMLWELKHENFLLQCWNSNNIPAIFQIWPDGNGFQEYHMPKTKNNLYYLFGDQVCREYESGGIKAVIKYIKKGGGYTIEKFTEGDRPEQILSAFEGWDKWYCITEEEYKEIAKY